MFAELTSKQKKSVMRGNWKPNLSWPDLLSAVGVSKVRAQMIHTTLSSPVHSDRMSVMSLMKHDKDPSVDDICSIYLGTLRALLMMFISQLGRISRGQETHRSAASRILGLRPRCGSWLGTVEVECDLVVRTYFDMSYLGRPRVRNRRSQGRDKDRYCPII